MNLCEICEKVEACVEVKHYEDGVLRELSLCAACAQQHGLNLPPNLADLLLETTLQDVSAMADDAGVGRGADATRRCPSCGMRIADFRKTGRLGCPDCYTAWPDVLEPMLMGMHRSLVYKGPSPSVCTAAPVDLEQALQAAVAREDYEAAARLRDRMRDVQHDRTEQQKEFLF